MRPRSRRLLAATLATSVVGVAVAGSAATAAKPRLSDFEAELKSSSRLEMKVDARDATSVRFSFAGRTAKGYVTDTDDDGEREFSRTVSAGSVKVGRRNFTVRACGADGCTTRTFREFVEFDD